MAKKVKNNNDLDGAEAKTSPRLTQLKVPAKISTFFHSTRNIILFLLVVFVLLITIVVVSVYHQAPPAIININSDGLTKQQYQTLSKTLVLPETENFFSVDLNEIQEKALALSWVDEISTTRDWQRGIVVDILPKKAVAKFGSTRLVDAKGEVFEPINSDELKQDGLVYLQGDTNFAPEIMQQMQQVNDWFEPLGMKVEKIILTPRMTWFISFNNGLRVVVDNENTAQKLFNLSVMLNNQLNSRQQRIDSIDLRYKNGFAIKWKSK